MANHKSGISWGGMRYPSTLIDLGFLPARVIKAFSAPGGDPMAVRLRGYTLSLRREEADRVEVELMIVALCGNQNAGKTTLFNLLTERPSMWATIPALRWSSAWAGCCRPYQQGKCGTDRRSARRVFVDSIFARAVTREYILREKPDIVIQVLDVTSLQRGLYLTLELMALGRPLVLALNMTEAYGKIRRHAGCPASTGASGRALHIHQRHRARRAAVSGRSHAGGKGRQAPASPVPFPWNRCPRRSTWLAQARYTDWIDRCLAVCLTRRNPPRLPLMDWLFSNRLLAWPILAALVLAVLFIAFGAPVKR